MPPRSRRTSGRSGRVGPSRPRPPRTVVAPAPRCIRSCPASRPRTPSSPSSFERSGPTPRHASYRSRAARAGAGSIARRTDHPALAALRLTLPAHAVWVGGGALAGLATERHAPELQELVDRLASSGLLISREGPLRSCPACRAPRSPEGLVYSAEDGDAYLVRFLVDRPAPRTSLLVWIDSTWKLLGTSAVLLHPDLPYSPGSLSAAGDRGDRARAPIGRRLAPELAGRLGDRDPRGEEGLGTRGNAVPSSPGHRVPHALQPPSSRRSGRRFGGGRLLRLGSWPSSRPTEPAMRPWRRSWAFPACWSLAPTASSSETCSTSTRDFPWTSPRRSSSGTSASRDFCSHSSGSGAACRCAPCAAPPSTGSPRGRGASTWARRRAPCASSSSTLYRPMASRRPTNPWRGR